MYGAPTDNNATLFAQGYNAVLNPPSAPASGRTWRPRPERGLRRQRRPSSSRRSPLTRARTRCSSPNDENAAPIITYLQTQGVKPYTFPVTGQDATLVGLQNIISGYQCGTVYKPIFLEAQAAAALAMYLRAGKTPPKTLDQRLRPRTPTPTTCRSRPCSRRRSGSRRRHGEDGRRTTGSCPRARSAPARFAADCSRYKIHIDGRKGLWLRMTRRLDTHQPSRAAREGARSASADRAPARRLSTRRPLAPGHIAAAPAARVEQALRSGPGADRVDLDISAGAGHGARRRQRRRQVDADQDDLWDLAARRGRDLLERQACPHPHPDETRRPRYRDGLPGPRAMRQPRHRPERVPRPRADAAPGVLDETAMELTAKETLSDLSVTSVRSIRQPVGSLSGGQRQAVAVARAVMCDAQARDHGRADRGARRRADGDGARPDQAPRRPAVSP